MERGKLKLSLAAATGVEDEYLTWLRANTDNRFESDSFGLDPAGVYSPPPCRESGCDRLAGGDGWCRPHADRRGGLRTGDVRQLAGTGRTSSFRYPNDIAPVVRAELAYAMTRRAGQPMLGHVRPVAFNLLAEALSDHRCPSVLLLGDDRRTIANACGASWPGSRSLLEYLIDSIQHERFGRPFRHPLGVRRGGSTRWSKSQQIPATWLRDLVDRWVSYRLNTEAASPQHVGQQESAVVEFAGFVVSRNVRSASGITRALMLDWLGQFNRGELTGGRKYSAAYRDKIMGAIQGFITTSRTVFEASIPANANFLQGERPRRAAPNPRFLEPRIIHQLRDEANLQRISNHAHRLIVDIMMSTGLRVGHACALPANALRDLNSGGTTDRWGLHFYESKSDRWCSLPIEPRLAHHIRVFQHSTAGAPKRHASQDLMFPNLRARKTGQTSPESINRTLDSWVAELDLRDAAGVPLRVTPHQFRHTFATEMLDKNVSLDVIRDLLTHRSIKSTEVYATVTDARLRREWEKARLVNISGAIVNLPTGPEGDAQWLLHRIGNAVQPLPNGYCGLPIQQTCPHANACLDCDEFMTTVDFVPVLIGQRREHQRFVDEAEAHGHIRLAEINRRPIAAIDRILSTIEQNPAQA